jgi:hypothetical protein
MRFLIPATTSPGRAPLGCGPSVPAAVPLVGCLTPPAVSRQARADGDVSRRCRPGPSPCRAFPSRAARSPLSGPLRPSPLVTGRAWCDGRALDPPGFPDAHLRSIALMGATRKRWPGSPRGSCVRFHVIAFEGDRASPAPSGPSAGITRLLRQLPRPRSLAPRASPFTRDGGFPSPRGRCSPGVAPPEPSSGPVLGPFVPRAVTPRVRSSFTTPRVANPGRRG